MNYDSSTSYIYRKLEKAIEKGIPYTNLELREWIEEDFPTRFFRYLEDKLEIDLLDGVEYNEEEKIALWKEQLKKAAAKKGVSLDKNVLYKWFPTKSKEINDPAISNDLRTRPKIYCLAYVLGLRYSKKTEKDEIRNFFNNVFHTRPYDLKEIQEIIWWYYLNQEDAYWYPNGLALYQRIEPLGNLRSNMVPNTSDLSIEKLRNFFTADVKNAIKNINTEEELETFLLLNWDTLNEEHRLLTAKRSVIALAAQAEYWAEIECEKFSENNITKKSISRDCESDDIWSNPSSNFLLSTITGVNVRQNKTENKKICMFPAYYDLDNVLQGRKVSATTLRKLIVILGLYCYTYSKIFFNSRPSCSLDEDREYSKEKCKEFINFTLMQAGFYPLYVYDSFDLPILYAIETNSSNPIEELRNIIKEIYF